jgi:nicotinamidase-related amidase
MGRTALLVIDMSNDLLKNPDNPLYCPHAEEVIERVVELVAFAHREGWPVVYVQDAHRVGDADFTVRPVHAVKGTWGAELIPELQRQRFPGDYDVPKRRHSGFSYTDLDLYLREEQVDEVVLCGAWTNVAVRATASDAFYQFYKVTIVTDCCISQTAAMHEAGLKDLVMFATLTTLDVLKLVGAK